MKKKKANATDAASLRQKAEERLKKLQSNTASVSSEADMLKLIHELEVHQIELVMQNEELVIAKEKARIAEEKYTALYDFAPSCYFSLSKEGKITELNFAAAKMLGKERSHLQNSLFGFFISTETKPAYNRFLEKVFSSKTKESCEVTLKVSGHPPMHVILSGICYENGQHCKLTATDITERKQAEKALREREEKMRSIYNVAPAGIGVVSNRVLKEVNPRICEMTGYSRDELIDKNARILYPSGEEYEFVGKEKYDQIKEKGTGKVETRWQKKDGTIIHVLMASTPIDKNDYSKGITFTALDITELKKSEKALLESEERFKALHNASFGGITIHDKGIILECNQGLSNITGYSYDELIGMDGLLLIAPESREMVMQNITQGYEKPYEAIGLRKNGELYPIRLEARNIPYMGKQVRTVEFRDITETKQAKEALRQSEEMMRNSQSVAHICSYSTNLNVTEIDKSQWVCSPEFYKIFGIDESYPHTIAGWAAFIHPDHREEVFAYHETVVKDKKPFNREYKIIRINDGAERWVHGTGKLEFDEKGTPIRMHGAIQDITGRKRAEKVRQLQHSIARATITTRNLNELFDAVRNELNSMIDAKNFVIALYNEETGMLSANVDRDEKDEIPEWPAEKSLSGYVIEQNKPVLLKKNDILRLHEEGIIDLIGTTAENWLGIPLKVEGKIFGAIVIQSYDNPDAYDQSSIETMELVAHELSIFIDRQRSEEKANKLSTAVEQSSVSVFITNRQGIIEYVNPFFTKLTGYTHNEVKDKNPRILKSGHHSKEFYQDMWDTILSGKVWEGEFLNKRKNGELYWSNTIISPIFDNNGLITNFVSIKEDITERNQAEEALKESEAKFRFITDNSIDVIWQMDLKLKFTFISPSIYSVFGFTQEEWIGSRLSQHCTLKEFFNMGRKALNAAKHFTDFDHLTFEAEMLKKDGTSIPVEITGKLLYNEKGLPSGFQGSTRDITERKKTEAELKKLKENLEDEVQEKTKELKERVSELERFHSATIEREFRIKELRDEIERLKRGDAGP